MTSFAFRAVCLLLVALALCQGAVAAPDMTPAKQILEALVKITDMSKAARTETAKLTFTAVLSFPKVSVGVTEIASEVSATADLIARTPPLGAANAKMVVVALKAFVRDHQAFLNVLIGKSGLLTLYVFGGTIRQALVTLEKAVISLETALIVVIPTEKLTVNIQFAALKATLKNALDVYEPPLNL